MSSPSVIRDAQVLWEFHQLPDEHRSTDIAIGLGGHDIGVAEHVADLYRQGWFPLVVFTGANAPTTVDRFPRGEAVHFAERAEALGVPADAILVETKATNTSENFTFTRELLLGRGLDPRSATIVSRPYQQRRAWATVRKLWPQLDVVCSARWLALEDYIASIGDEQRVLNMLVGDTQRLWVYADAGFAVPVKVPDDVRGAYERLVKAGYTKRLLVEE
ncbi:YdcF family protein [Myceligenerans pegani]|uniref:YdcF family protein n=1 Tax=Myceligenerans pegani TaxID=2776917 RepID=A0ABR9MYZ0_9MICO|nr:YdcF family protein [Myceligenerans sp. TRM 65318]MBE1876615.1 YdcF family protein [Myceligenerans sp. TRM 65318]MBE3018886.1 YdcF family protein [Myceligenerans sp. TRM 65318]